MSDNESKIYDTLRIHYKRSEEVNNALLEAVKDALAFLDRPDITTYEWYKLAPDHVAKFRRAIAKAEGPQGDMSEEQTIIFPSVCLGCKAARVGVQENEAVYECGTRIRINPKERSLTANRSNECLEGAPHGEQTDSTPQP